MLLIPLTFSQRSKSLSKYFAISLLQLPVTQLKKPRADISPSDFIKLSSLFLMSQMWIPDRKQMFLERLSRQQMGVTVSLREDSLVTNTFYPILGGAVILPAITFVILFYTDLTILIENHCQT